MDKETVKHVATLSRLAMSDSELDRFTEQVSAILDYIDKLHHLDTTTVEPMSHALALKNVYRSDESGPSHPQEKAQENAPEREVGYYRVPRIIE